IREYFKEDRRKVTLDGKEILERKFKTYKIDFNSENIEKLLNYYNLSKANELYVLVGKGTIDKTEINIDEIFAFEKNKELEIKIKHETKKQNKKLLKTDSIIIGEGDSDLKYSFAGCCNPIPGDDIFAFVTIGEGVKIHQTNCPNGVDLMANYGYRILKARWTNSEPGTDNRFLTSIKITGTDSVGIVRGITDVRTI
ncbi:MAG: bifunctional (p)ppGpp synthetase/guanosine-3',5'-bis(diphosphate) 3'-pyrophosphohydrolase, partial [Bacteroidetes bacterium]|nr:bifunctional (p)ppGpp synthetase/guanosine-3',5'-bis(diphosphate) 3'-pyrophosphohydrolase [Bacteroidota bacterium]